MLNYFRQNIIRHSIFIGLIFIASIVNNHNLSCVCLLVAQFMFIIELCIIDSYLEKHATKYSKDVRKILLSIGTTYILIGIVLSLSYLYQFEHLDVYRNLFLGFGVILVFFITTFLLLKYTYKTTYYHLILTIRYLWQISKAIIILYAVCMIGFLCISGAVIFADEAFLNSVNPIIPSYIIISYLICEFVLLFLGYKSIKKIPRQTMLYFRKSFTILYLRSFEIDHTSISEKCIGELYLFTRKHKYNLIKVGNPNSIFEMDSYYLPTTNWKYHVERLIRSHKMIFVVLGKTPGLAWEVIKHEEFWGKYVFYIPDSSIYKYWTELANSENDKRFSEILNKIVFNNNGIAFYIEEDVPYYSESICDIVLAHEKGIYMPTITCSMDTSLIPERKIKLSSEHMVYLYDKHNNLIVSVNQEKPVYLSLDEQNKIVSYRQKFSRVYEQYCQNEYDTSNFSVCPIHLKTRNLFKIYFNDYKYYRLIIEPIIIGLIIYLLSLKILPWPIELVLGIIMLLLLFMMVYTFCVSIFIDILIFLKNKFK